MGLVESRKIVTVNGKILSIELINLDNDGIIKLKGMGFKYEKRYNWLVYSDLNTLIIYELGREYER